MRLLLFLCVAIGTLAPLGRTGEASQRFAVLVGSNRGKAAQTELRFAVRDARRLADVLVELGGFAAEDVVVLDQYRRQGIARAKQ